jgi:hypothetical protein
VVCNAVENVENTGRMPPDLADFARRLKLAPSFVAKTIRLHVPGPPLPAHAAAPQDAFSP